MKTLQHPAKLISIIILMFFFGMMMVFTSCQKDEQPMTKTSDNNISESRMAAASFKMIIIDHSAANTSLPDFRIETNNDGNLIFIGRRNTAFIGKQKLQISPDEMGIIKEMMIHDKFLSMESQPAIPDMPQNITIFHPELNGEEYFRRDNGNSSALGAIRSKIENMLNISNLIYLNRNKENIQVEMTQKHD
jgi:hypothetical protein